MHYKDVLKTCAATLNDRGENYGDSDACFDRIAKIASLVLDRPITRYDVAIILACVKLGRMPGNPTYDDNYVDLANYAAFASHFSEPPRVSPVENLSVKMHRFPKGDMRSFASGVTAAQASAALNTVEEDVIERPADKK